MKKILILGVSSMIGHQLHKYLIKKKIKAKQREVKKRKNFYYYDPITITMI